MTENTINADVTMGVQPMRSSRGVIVSSSSLDSFCGSGGNAMIRKFYHGSQVRDIAPTYGLGNDAHDYGRGFYTMVDKELGRLWAVGQQANADGRLHVFMKEDRT